MNTWFVGNVPIGHNVYARTADSEAIGKKVFYMKARIMAGQANLSENTMGLEDFVWVTKDEIPDIAGNKYFKSVQHMLVQQ